jgi:hypothetical protein
MKMIFPFGDAKILANGQMEKRELGVEVGGLEFGVWGCLKF